MKALALEPRMGFKFKSERETEVRLLRSPDRTNLNPVKVKLMAMLSLEAEERIKTLQEFNLKFLEEQLIWKDGYSDKLAHECVAEYRKWIALHIAMHDSDFVGAYFSGEHLPLGMPSRHIDNTWHRHILFTRDYAVFCESVAGRMIHHNPCTRRNVAMMSASATQRAYRILFGEMPEIWNIRESFLASANNAGCGCGCENRD